LPRKTVAAYTGRLELFCVMLLIAAAQAWGAGAQILPQRRRIGGVIKVASASTDAREARVLDVERISIGLR
jgi:hypothetical protein